MAWHFIVFRANPHPGKEKANAARQKHGGKLDRYFESDDGSLCYALFDGGHGRKLADELGATTELLDLELR
jgi:hypothetical protein